MFSRSMHEFTSEPDLRSWGPHARHPSQLREWRVDLILARNGSSSFILWEGDRLIGGSSSSLSVYPGKLLELLVPPVAHFTV